MAQARAREILRRILPTPKYKGTRGRIGIVGGARDYAGAPYFAAIASMRLGADLAYVVCSRTASHAIKNYSPDLIVSPILDCENDTEFTSEIDCLLGRLHALVIGPGLGREKLIQSRAKKIIQEAKARSLPLVLDADSLLLVNEDPSIIQNYSKAILTPNRIELQRLLNVVFAPKSFDLKAMPTEEIEKLVQNCSTGLGVPILAKGMVDIICCPSGFQLMTDKMSGSNRRCGGQGDLLSGMLGVYLHWMSQAQEKAASGVEKLDHSIGWAGYLAATTTRNCNELAFKEFRNGMLASDMVGKVHTALESLLDVGPEVPTNGASASPLLATDGNVGERQSDRIKNASYTGSLTQDEISRYARQMIMEEFGPERQMRLKQASAIIIGAGGLGCPAAVYLGAGGIGRLGIVDDDKVEASNLHRQILHNLEKVGMLKTESIKEAVLAINPNVRIDTHSVKMDRHNAVRLIEDYDIVIDATDNLLTRYMISDACVIAKKPLVSGAALKMDGQLTVYNYDNDTPCFRCLFPEPPTIVGSCSENGVLGVIPGVIGVHQALEAMKIAAGMRPAYAGKMLLFDGQLGLFRHVTLGKRKANCEACGPGSKLGRDLINYEEFCGQLGCQQPGGASSNILESDERVTNEQYRAILESGVPHVLIDVRPLAHSEVSRFAHALPIPVLTLLNDQNGSLEQIKKELERKGTNSIYVVCRRGIASQRGTRIIQDLMRDERPNVVVKDIIGGMTAWASQIDPSYTCV